MTKQHVLFIILIVGIVLAFSKYGRADSIICNDIIFTETSNIERIPNDGENVLRGTIGVKKIEGYRLGANITMHSGADIYFNKMTQCMEIEDEVDSVKNLRWFLEKSMDARISNWKQK